MLHFPDAGFAWVYYLLLIGLLLVASYTDVRWVVIPKWLTIPMLLIGVLLNVCRMAWLATLGEETWHLGTGSVWVGAADGFLFSLEGFAVGFGLFLVMWILGTAGGGDLKLFAALVPTWGRCL